MGNPTTRTRAKERDILRALAVGRSFRKASAFAGVPWPTMIGWMKDADFRRRCEQAREGASVERLETLRTVVMCSKDASDWLKYVRLMEDIHSTDEPVADDNELDIIAQVLNGTGESTGP